MKFEEVLPALREGKKIKRKYWGENYIKRDFRFLVGQIIGQDSVIYALTILELEADDWEIIKEPKKVKLRDLTEEQYDLWIENNCAKHEDSCRGCPFQKVQCDNHESLNDAWYLNKDLYSDKFLYQEIEVEED